MTVSNNAKDGNPSSPIEIHALVKGRVQGVGFRATVREYARKHGFKGTVRNTFDGDVEIYVQGTAQALGQFMEALKAGLGLGKGHVDPVFTEVIKIKGSYPDFSIVD